MTRINGWRWMLVMLLCCMPALIHGQGWHEATWTSQDGLNEDEGLVLSVADGQVTITAPTGSYITRVCAGFTAIDLGGNEEADPNLPVLAPRRKVSGTQTHIDEIWRGKETQVRLSWKESYTTIKVVYADEHSIAENGNLQIVSTTIALEEGETFSLSASYEWEGSTLKDVVWTTDDERIATVDAEGRLEALAAGTTTLTATTTDFRALQISIAISVTQHIYTLQDLVTLIDELMNENETKNLPKALDADGDGNYDLDDVEAILNILLSQPAPTRNQQQSGY